MTFFESIGVPEQGKAGIFCCVIDLDFQLIKSWAPPCTFGSCLKKKNMLYMLGYQCCFAEVVKIVCNATLKTPDNILCHMDFSRLIFLFTFSSVSSSFVSSLEFLSESTLVKKF